MASLSSQFFRGSRLEKILRLIWKINLSSSAAILSPKVGFINIRVFWIHGFLYLDSNVILVIFFHNFEVICRLYTLSNSKLSFLLNNRIEFLSYSDVEPKMVFNIRACSPMSLTQVFLVYARRSMLNYTPLKCKCPFKMSSLNTLIVLGPQSFLTATLHICVLAHAIVVIWTSLWVLSSRLTYGSSKCRLLKQGLTYYASWQFCDEILSWMIDIWMKNHLISDSNCNIVNL